MKQAKNKQVDATKEDRLKKALQIFKKIKKHNEELNKIKYYLSDVASSICLCEFGSDEIIDSL